MHIISDYNGTQNLIIRKRNFSRGPKPMIMNKYEKRNRFERVKPELHRVNFFLQQLYEWIKNIFNLI